MPDRGGYTTGPVKKRGDFRIHGSEDDELNRLGV